MTVVCSPYSRHMAVIMHDIEVTDSTVTLRNITEHLTQARDPQ